MVVSLGARGYGNPAGAREQGVQSPTGRAFSTLYRVQCTGGPKIGIEGAERKGVGIFSYQAGTMISLLYVLGALTIMWTRNARGGSELCGDS